MASLQEAKRNTSKSSSNCGQNAKNRNCVNEELDRNSVYSKLNNTHNNSQQIDSKSSECMPETNCSLLSLAAHRRARVSAQRKFAQSSGSNNNSPVSTPIKIGLVAPQNVVELFPNQKPKTEDFLTFLCLRRSPILPPNLDFVRLNKKVAEDEKVETDTEIISCDEFEQNISEKYTSCRLRNSDRRGSASSNLSKTTSMSSKASLQFSNSKKSDFQKTAENKCQNLSKLKRTQSNCSDSHQSSASLPGPVLKQSHSKRIATKSTTTNDELETKSFNKLKEKYKQQRIVKKSNISSNLVKCNKRKDFKNSKEDRNKGKELEGIQTRQSLRNYSYNQKEGKPSDIKSERVLRSHDSGVCTHTLPLHPKKLLMQNVNRKQLKPFNSSQVGVRPQKRKAKPVVPLIDYYFDSEFESDSSKKNTRSNQKKVLNSTELKTKNRKNLSENHKNKEIKEIFHKSLPNDNKGMTRTPGRPKGSTKSANKAKTSLSSEPRRLTRSSRSFSPPKDSKDLERERLIKQQIIEIEKKHKRLRRFPSDQSLHSSTTSSSSSSSESLPNSSSSSSSINIPRLTRSLEHLKKIRDIAAKLKKEQNKKRKEDKKSEKTEDSVPKVKERSLKRKKRQNLLKSTKDESTKKVSKVINKRTKSLTKSKERSFSKKVNESVMTATSDTDCDTEGIVNLFE